MGSANASVVLLLIVALAGCGGDGTPSAGAEDRVDSTAVAEEAAEGDSSDVEIEKKEKAIRVDVGEVRRGDLVLPVFADGVLRTPRSVEVRTKVGGELAAVLVEDGDRVRAGQLLVRIDQRQYALALDESRSRHFQALSQIAAEAETLKTNGEALSDFESRRRELENERRRGDLDRDTYQDRLLDLELGALRRGAFRQEVLEQRTGLAEARVAEERARLDLENTEIRAPFAGIVQGVAVVPGEVVSIGSPLCSIYDNDRLEAAVNVLETDLGDLEEGRPALAMIPATRDTVRARVDVISPRLDETSRTCEVLIRFASPSARLRPGMFVRAEIAGWIHPERLVVPREAVLWRDDRALVFKAVQDRAQWLYVDTGLENDEWIEILRVHSGGTLAPGDRVVVSDHLTLAHEAKIRVRKTVSPANRWAFATATTESSP
jgi:multidrug efflux pump subunit AcrA (membrane-fusion protein)